MWKYAIREPSSRSRIGKGSKSAMPLIIPSLCDFFQPEGATMAKRQEQTTPTARMASLLLSLVAGWVDSCTFLALFGLFVAQVTGSFVDAGAQIAGKEQGFLLITFAIPIFLVAGAVTTLLVVSTDDRGASPLAWSLALESALLIGFLVAGIVGSPFDNPHAPLAVIAGLFGLSAMGTQSALVQLLMHGTPSTKVMTTNTTQVAILATKAVLCWRERDDSAAAQFASTKDRLMEVLWVVTGFLTGTIAGALAYSAVDLWCLLVPIAVILGLLTWSLQCPALIGSGSAN
jgi:uncharacterized membrane protein YoaK (UPF0700 family)